MLSFNIKGLLFSGQNGVQHSSSSIYRVVAQTFRTDGASQRRIVCVFKVFRFVLRHRVNCTIFLEEACYHRRRTRCFGAEQERNANFGDCSAAAIVLHYK